MEYLWSPWRMVYIQNSNMNKSCVFCSALESEDSADNLVVVRTSKAFVILNRFPYTSGHLMIVPYSHVASLELLDAEIRADMMELTTQTLLVLRREYGPQGFNIGINIGEIAGAGIADHVHLHIVPRWGGDTNFMSSVGGTRVLPEALEETYQRIRKAWETRD